MADQKSLIITDLPVIAQLWFPRESQPEMISVSRMDGRRKVGVARFWQLWFLIKQIEDSIGTSFNKVDAILIVNINNLLDT